MQKTFVDAATQVEPQVLIRSKSGDGFRKTRLLFTVVGSGTLYVDKDPGVTQETGVPFVEGVYGSDELLIRDETLYAVAADGEEIDVRYITQGAGSSADDSVDDED